MNIKKGFWDIVQFEFFVLSYIGEWSYYMQLSKGGKIVPSLHLSKLH